MKANDIVIKIYNMPTLRMDLAEKWIKEYAMNVAHHGYLLGHEDGRIGLNPQTKTSLSEMDTDNHN